MMKKIMKTLVILTLVAISIAGCAHQKTQEKETDIGIVDDQATTNEFLTAPEKGSELEAYRAELNKRLMKGEKFVTNEEAQMLSKNGFWVTGTILQGKYIGEEYFPVVYKTKTGEIQLCSTTSKGVVYIKSLNGGSSTSLGNLNYPETGNGKVIDTQKDLTVVYDLEEGAITFWSLGEKIDEARVPHNSVYTGCSIFEGFIFRSGSDVYAVRCPQNGEGYETVIIANKVAFVIDASYSMGSDDWSQPLFQMTDGSIKAYCSWMGVEGALVDDESHLYPINYEGGYDK